MQPTIIIIVEDGCDQNILTNIPESYGAKVVVIDYDCEEFTGHKVDGHDVYVGEFTPEYLPEHVDALMAEAQEEHDDPEEDQTLAPCYPGKPLGSEKEVSNANLIVTNNERAAIGERALRAVFDRCHEEEIGTEIYDLVADLLHLARENGIEPDYIIRMAQMHFDAELEEEAES